jgi:hypothetical protein
MTMFLLQELELAIKEPEPRPRSWEGRDVVRKAQMCNLNGLEFVDAGMLH